MFSLQFNVFVYRHIKARLNESKDIIFSQFVFVFFFVFFFIFALYFYTSMSVGLCIHPLRVYL